MDHQKEKVKPLKPKKKGRYKTTAEMIRAMAGDEVSAERSIRQLNERCLIDHLMAQRALLGLAQGDIAKKMECTQSRVSKLENGKDDDLRIGDFRDYADALGFELVFLLTRKKAPIVDQVKQHVFAIRKLLMRLVKLAGDDESMADGTEKFFREVIVNSVRVVLEASDRLAGNLDAANKNGLLVNIPNEPPPPIQFDDESGGESCPLTEVCGQAGRPQLAPA